MSADVKDLLSLSPDKATTKLHTVKRAKTPVDLAAMQQVHYTCGFSRQPLMHEAVATMDHGVKYVTQEQFTRSLSQGQACPACKAQFEVEKLTETPPAQQLNTKQLKQAQKVAQRAAQAGA